ncbi:MAG: flagellin FliC [Deltaproteobacteria bacterium]|nr:flagellin FliC [Deltaproteobacteria bacterium]
MSLTVVNNVSSINAQRHVNKSQQSLGKSLEKLSSGLRINRAADDAAGLAISEKLRANVRALGQAGRNVNDAVSLLQTTEGAMGEVSDMLIRMKELSEQAATGTLGTTERGYLNTEYQALRTEITRIADNTKFNETSLLDGTLSKEVQVGITSGESITVAFSDIDSAALSLTSSISTVTNASAALTSTTTAISTVASRRASVGALQNRFESISNSIANQVENLTAAESRIRDVDIAAESANLTKNSILVQAGVSVLAQANQTPQIALALLS